MKVLGLDFDVLDKSVWLLIAVNVYPIIGVLFFDWNYLSVVVLYIIETFIIGLFNVPKMIMARGEPAQLKSTQKTSNSKELALGRGCLKLFLIPFFLFHFNAFVLGQSIFVFVISNQFGGLDTSFESFSNLEFGMNILLLLFGHAYSFYFYFIKKKEYLLVSEDQLMLQPYKRIFIQQFTVIFGVFVILATGAPIFFLVMLIVFKLFFDLRAHYKMKDIFSEFHQAK